MACVNLLSVSCIGEMLLYFLQCEQKSLFYSLQVKFKFFILYRGSIKERFSLLMHSSLCNIKLFSTMRTRQCFVGLVGGSLFIFVFIGSWGIFVFLGRGGGVIFVCFVYLFIFVSFCLLFLVWGFYFWMLSTRYILLYNSEVLIFN